MEPKWLSLHYKQLLNNDFNSKLIGGIQRQEPVRPYKLCY